MKKGWQIFFHIAFWTSITAYFTLVTHNNSKIGTEGLIVIFVLYGCLNVGLFYLNYLFLLPRYLDKKEYRSFTVALIISLIVLGLIKYGLALIFSKYVLIHDNGRVVVGFAAYFTGATITGAFFYF